MLKLIQCQNQSIDMHAIHQPYWEFPCCLYSFVRCGARACACVCVALNSIITCVESLLYHHRPNTEQSCMTSCFEIKPAFLSPSFHTSQDLNSGHQWPIPPVFLIFCFKKDMWTEPYSVQSFENRLFLLHVFPWRFPHFAVHQQVAPSYCWVVPTVWRDQTLFNIRLLKDLWTAPSLGCDEHYGQLLAWT